MYNKLYLILACVFVLSCGASALSRETFQARFRHCRWLCAWRDSQQKNTLQTCRVLADHQNVTVSRCVGRCLEKHEENLTNSTECQCENGKCTAKAAPIEPSSPGTSSTTPSSTPGDSSSSQSASSTTSASSETTSPASTTSSTTSPSSAASSSQTPVTQRSIDDFDEEIMNEFE